VLEDALMKLVQDVRSDQKKYIGEWETLPEWMVNRFEASIMTCGMEHCRVMI
jgi:hypothetical protein